MTMISVPEWPWRTVQRLAKQRDAHVWLVGGAVRDILLDRIIRDWDFAVAGDALELARAAADALGGAYYPLDAGRGTGRALAMAPNGVQAVLDFAALRGPDLRTDLCSRDFTINALAVDAQGLLMDPAGGAADLEARRVRVVGDEAFEDDPLRLLRAVRVASELGFEIDPTTSTRIRRDAALVTRPSPERVRDELMRILALPGAGPALKHLDDLCLLGAVVPELGLLKGLTQSPPHQFDAWHHTLVMLDAVQIVLGRLVGYPMPQGCLADVPAYGWDRLGEVLGPFAARIREHLTVRVSGEAGRTDLLKLGALLHDVGKAETWERDADGRIHFYDHGEAGARLARVRLRELRFAGVVIDRVGRLISGHLRPGQLARADKVTRRAVYRYFRALGDAGVDVVLLSLADHVATWGSQLQQERWDRRLAVASSLLGYYFECYEEAIDRPPLLSGRDLMAELGVAAGPEVGRLLDVIREAQAVGEVRTREDAVALARRSVRSA